MSGYAIAWTLNTAAGNGDSGVNIDKNGGIITCRWIDGGYNDYHFLIGNVHKTEKDAKAYKKKLIILLKR